MAEVFQHRYKNRLTKDFAAGNILTNEKLRKEQQVLVDSIFTKYKTD